MFFGWDMIRSFIRRYSSFTYLNITQFLGAMNDNIYKLLIIYFFIQIEGIENSPVILATTGATFVLPFLLFSSSAGLLADRYSKSRIIIMTKIFEFVTMAIGLVAFKYSSKVGSYCILFLLAAQAALFSPSKYGILPEMLPREEISKANGMMTSFTYLAIIVGTFLASFLLDITGRNFTIASLFCIVVSLIGVITSFCIEYTPPSGSRKQLNAHFISDIYRTLKMVAPQPSLLAAILGSAFFLFLASYVQLNIIPFAVQSLNLTDVQGGYLFLLTAIGIGTGSLVAGKISGKTVELALSPIAALGITVCFFLLYSYSSELFLAIPLVIIIGLFGGMYLIPLDSYVQIASPKQYIGQAVASSTFMGFIGVLCSSGLLYFVSQMLGFKADQGFAILGCITLFVTCVYSYLFFDYIARFVGSILSRLHFKTDFNGEDKIPNTPALYVCTHTAWNDTLLMLGAQRRRMRFFIENEQDHSKWLKKMYRLLRVVLIPEIEPLENNGQCLEAIKKTLDKGISVCIFVNDADIDREFNKLKHAHLLQEILDEKQYPMILVRIEKGTKQKQPRFFTRLLNKCRVPASMSFETIVESGVINLSEDSMDLHTTPAGSKGRIKIRPVLLKEEL
jgi:acyl-[acyl-carrier-protein]-phospholipid O-acyltransferase / long-chain-fatty-acid--[acyl-carrier-protein] ligase